MECCKCFFCFTAGERCRWLLVYYWVVTWEFIDRYEPKCVNIGANWNSISVTARALAHGSKRSWRTFTEITSSEIGTSQNRLYIEVCVMSSGSISKFDCVYVYYSKDFSDNQSQSIGQNSKITVSKCPLKFFVKGFLLLTHCIRWWQFEFDG